MMEVIRSLWKSKIVIISVNSDIYPVRAGFTCSVPRCTWYCTGLDRCLQGVLLMCGSPFWVLGYCVDMRGFYMSR